MHTNFNAPCRLLRFNRSMIFIILRPNLLDISVGCRIGCSLSVLLVLKTTSGQKVSQMQHRQQTLTISDNQTVLSTNPTLAQNITLAVTGASGSIYAAEMLRALVADPRVARIHFVASESALRVFATELQLSGRNDLPEKLLGHVSDKIDQQADTDIGAAIASG